jgi:hypothetical protein
VYGDLIKSWTELHRSTQALVVGGEPSVDGFNYVFVTELDLGEWAWLPWMFRGDKSLLNYDKIYTNKLVCQDSTGKILWTKQHVSTQVAVIDKLCYYIKVINFSTKLDICVCNAETGKMEKILYREQNEEREINLLKTANRTLYIKSEDPISSDLYRINGYTIKQLHTIKQ